MAEYAPQVWTDQVTDADAAHMNHMEAGIANAIPKPTTPPDRGAVVWDAGTSSWVAAALDNRSIAAGAAIARSKLDFGSGLTNADIAAAAAIAKSKLAALNIADADVAGGAAISRSKLNFGAGLVDADIAAAAAIAASKIAAPYTAYTPTLSSSGGGGAVSNGTIVGRYVQIGKFVHYAGRLILGTLTSFGSGILWVSLPVTAANSGTLLVGNGYAFDQSASVVCPTLVIAVGTSTMRFTSSATYNSVGQDVSGTTPFPFSWAVSDELNWNVTYEAA
jgi:hypothetical protein